MWTVFDAVGGMMAAVAQHSEVDGSEVSGARTRGAASGLRGHDPQIASS